MQRRKSWQPHLSQPTDNAHLLICTHNPLPVQINSVHFMSITPWTSLCQMQFTSCDLRSNKVSWKSKQSVYALSENVEDGVRMTFGFSLYTMCYNLRLRVQSKEGTLYCLAQKNSIRFLIQMCLLYIPLVHGLCTLISSLS